MQIIEPGVRICHRLRCRSIVRRGSLDAFLRTRPDRPLAGLSRVPGVSLDPAISLAAKVWAATSSASLFDFSASALAKSACAAEEDDNTHALKVRMIQPKQPRDGLRGTRETASGYMFRLSNMYVLLLTDDLTDDLRVTIFPRSKMDEVGTDINKNSLYAGRHDHVVHLDGFGLGLTEVRGSFLPCICHSSTMSMC